ncbi:MAG: LapA family protein [Deltaproteobacteria bacterium]|nr:LapA family protein [Deltaproteobacteria bacterium]
MIKKVVSLILLALVIVFVIQNTQVVEVQFFSWKISMSRALLLLATFVVGIFVGLLSTRLKPRDRKKA